MQRWPDTKWKKAFRSRLKDLDLVAIYVVGPLSGNPLKIGYAKSLKARLSSYRVSHWSEDIKVHFYRYCEGRIAKCIEKSVHSAFIADGKCIRGEWFDTSVDEAQKLILETAKRLGTRLYSQEAIDASFRQRSEIELERALRL